MIGNPLEVPPRSKTLSAKRPNVLCQKVYKILASTQVEMILRSKRIQYFGECFLHMGCCHYLAANLFNAARALRQWP